MPIKAVLFDMFDTLMMVRRNSDFYSPSLMRMYKFLNAHGIDVTFDVFEQAYTKARDEIYAKVEEDLGEPHFNFRVVETLKSLGYSYDVSDPLVTNATAEFCEAFNTFVTPDPETQTVLRSLYGNYKLGIVSNFAMPECVVNLLQIHGFYDLFDLVLVSGAVNKRKPSPEIFNIALTKLGVSAHDTAVVGDTINADVEGAKAVGAISIYIQRRNEPEIDRIKPDRIIKKLSEVPLILMSFQEEK